MRSTLYCCDWCSVEDKRVQGEPVPGWHQLDLCREEEQTLSVDLCPKCSALLQHTLSQLSMSKWRKHASNMGIEGSVATPTRSELRAMRITDTQVRELRRLTEAPQSTSRMGPAVAKTQNTLAAKGLVEHFDSSGVTDGHQNCTSSCRITERGKAVVLALDMWRPQS